MRKLVLSLVVVLIFATATICAVAGDQKPMVTSSRLSDNFNAKLPGLKEAYHTASNFEGKGNVVLLNNGLIVVEVPTKLTTDAKGIESVREVVVFQLPTVQPAEGELVALLEYEDVEFDIFWDFAEDSKGVYHDALISVITPRQDIEYAVEYLEASELVLGPSCKTTCGVGGVSKCTQSCAADEACIAYCSAGKAHCACVDKPKPEPVE